MGVATFSGWVGGLAATAVASTGAGAVVVPAVGVAVSVAVDQLGNAIIDYTGIDSSIKEWLGGN